MNFFNRLADRYSKVEPLPVGTHHLQTMQDEKPYRVHLRLQKDGSGVLIINASTVLQLNPTAAECAFHFIKGTAPEDAAEQIAARYRINKKSALEDFNNFTEQIHTLISTPDLDPVSYMGFEQAGLHSSDLTTPLRLDCALTYQLPANSQAEYAPVKRVTRELNTEEWKIILNKAWSVGIPHITFTGGEATLRNDLPELIAHAENMGQVCGLLTDGLKLADKKYLHLLLQTGLDHILFILQPGSKASWKALETIMAEDIFVTVHITMNQDNIKNTGQVLEQLADLKVQSLSLTIADNSLNETYDTLCNKAADLGLSLKFDLPVPYSANHPVALETLEDNIPDGAGKAWLYVEPDGDVLPTQGRADQVLGNFLTDEWNTIHPKE